MNDIRGSKHSWTIQEHCRYEKTPPRYSVNAHIACKVGNWWTSVVFATKRVDIPCEHTYSIVYHRWLCIGLWNGCILHLAAQYLSFCSQMEIVEENRKECRTCFIRGLYQDLHKKYEYLLAKNADLVKLMSELCADNEWLREKQQ